MVDIVTRPQWGSNPVNCSSPWLSNPTPDCWLHHTVGNFSGASGMRQLQQAALSEGYSDIEYSFLTGDDGVSFEGRGAGRKTAAQNAPGGPDNNSRSHALCAFGNFETKMPSDKLITGLSELVAYLFVEGFIAAPRITGPHGQAPGCATACCGRNLTARIPDINAMAAGTKPPPSKTKGGAMDIVRTPSGRGYYVVAADGGVFCYGDAKFHGSMGGKVLNSPIVGMAVMPKNNGYFLAAADGGVFNFGASVYYGSMGGTKLNAPIVGCEYDAEGDGYWLLAQDGGIFTFGKTSFYGAPTGHIKYP